MRSHSKDDIAARVRRGDASAFLELVRRSSARLLRLASRLMGNVQAGEDILQESYLRAFEALRRGDFEGESELATWLHSITINVALDALRTTKRRENLLRNASRNELTQSASTVEAYASLREILEWVADLPPDQRVALLLKDLEGWTSAEIGESMKCSEGAVEQRLLRARRALRKRRT